MKKSQIIQEVINLSINPNFEGNKANGQRWEMTKHLRKKSKNELTEILKKLKA